MHDTNHTTPTEIDHYDALTLALDDMKALAELLDALGCASVGDGCSGIAKEPLMRGIGAIGRVMGEKSATIHAEATALIETKRGAR